MTTASGNYVCDNSTLANFKSWAQAISGAFSTLGWTQTSDTGQVNWGSISSVPSSAYVYEVWKAADALAASMPIYVKIEYGVSSTTPQIRVTVGTGSNGSGTINGQVISSAPWQVTNGPSNGGSTTYPCFFSGSAGEFRMMMWSNYSPASGDRGTMLVIERSKDQTGANSNEYVTVLLLPQSNAGGAYQQSFTASAVALRNTGIVAPAIPSLNTTRSTAFSSVAALPVLPLLGKVGQPMLGVMSACTYDVGTSNTAVTVASLYGGSHNYLVYGGGADASISSALGQRSFSAGLMSALMRYE